MKRNNGNAYLGKIGIHLTQERGQDKLYSTARIVGTTVSDQTVPLYDSVDTPIST